MSWLVRAAACLAIAAAAGLAWGETAMAAGGSYAITTSPSHGLAGATFSVQYTRSSGPCGGNGTVQVYWGAVSGSPMATTAWSSSCTVTLSSLKPPNGTAPGTYAVWGRRVVSSGEVSGSRVSTTYVVDKPPPPPSPSPPKPGPQPTATSTSTANPQPAGSQPGTSTGGGGSAPVAVLSTGNTGGRPGNPPPGGAGPGAPVVAGCQGAGCAAKAPPAASIGLSGPGAGVESPLLVFAAVLVALAGVLYLVWRRGTATTPVPQPVTATAPIAPDDHTALDPVIPDPATREIYSPPVGAVLPGDEGLPAPAAAAASTSDPGDQPAEDVPPSAPGDGADDVPVAPTARGDELPPMAPRPD